MRLFKLFIGTFLFILIIINTFNLDVYNYANNKIEVEVKGNVKNEGIYELEAGSCFNDLLSLIELKDDSDISSYSLSMPLYNKQVIVIDMIDTSLNKISINTASKNELITLPGIGDKTADLIIEYRNTNNGFKYIEELLNIKGIGEKKFEKIKDRISL